FARVVVNVEVLGLEHLKIKSAIANLVLSEVLRRRWRGEHGDQTGDRKPLPLTNKNGHHRPPARPTFSTAAASSSELSRRLSRDSSAAFRAWLFHRASCSRRRARPALSVARHTCRARAARHRSWRSSRW